MVKDESKIWEKLFGKKISTERLSIEGFKTQIPFDIYDGFAICNDYRGQMYDMSYPQLKAIKDSKEMSDAVIEYINSISEKQIESVEEISVIHVLIAFNTIFRNGTEIIPKK